MAWDYRAGKIVLTGVLLLIGMTSSQLWGEPMKVITEHSPPGEYLDENGRVTGATAELVRELMRRAGEPGEIIILPWARGYRVAQKESNVALFETARSELREDQFKWVGPIKRITSGFFVRREDGIAIETLDDARKLKGICAYRGGSGGESLLALGFTNLEQPTRPAQCLDMLMHGRVDAWITSDIGRLPLFADSAFSADDVELAYITSVRYLYIAMSLDTEDARVELWQDTLDNMKRDGTLAQHYRGTYPDEMIQALSEPDLSDLSTPD
ncbi:ABC transporter substrate-binding protein [Marinobacter alexandrii]|jgi:polar amino acid transport system substrate-binding protein|uniref:substrate-binding periplasmic protein n=1 Tax=Marinobacter alexandrii TaxID=2570351 RepID=UPI002ABDA2EA|nr:ABC transporter substrate-binding protein [Marinobacter alexandrii]MCK2151295.1 transporter substrate-binding domain-containing protein [Marinobacter alexandrii]